MKRTAVLLFVLLPAIFSLGWSEDTAHAVKGALRLRDGMHDPDSFQVSRVLITGKGVCIEYRSRNGSGAMSTGFAVYKADKDVEYVDNSWVWQRDCLFGKLAQRRDGKDVTEAVRAALKGPTAPGFKGEQLAAQPVAPAAPLARASGKQPVTPTAPVETPASTTPTRVAAVAPAPVAKAPAARPVTPAAPVGVTVQSAKAMALRPSAPVSESRLVTPAAVAPVEAGTVRGATLTGSNGEITASAAPESLGEVARRLRKEKQKEKEKKRKPVQ
jgi:hypothetical protein